MVCHCLLIETPSQGLVLVDTGFGLADVEHATRRLGRFFQMLARPRLTPDDTAIRQIERLGFMASDVRNIVVTHLDLDHAGGLSDFPQAHVHVRGPELDAVLRPQNHVERMRYRRVQLEHSPQWIRHDTASGEPWFGFECVRELPGLPPEVLLVPLGGHTRGHTGVAVQQASGWLLHAGDAYFSRSEIDPLKPSTPPGLVLHEKSLAWDLALCRRNIERLRVLAREQAGKVRVFCAHDRAELEEWGMGQRQEG